VTQERSSVFGASPRAANSAPAPAIARSVPAAIAWGPAERENISSNTTNDRVPLRPWRVALATVVVGCPVLARAGRRDFTGLLVP
jgi:hypothetical protein